jgi:proteasome accessory factor C
MDKLHRITALKRILTGRRTPISLRQLKELLGCSESTTRRILRSYRDDFGAPVSFDRGRGWYLDGPAPETADEVPGLWFTTDELHALLSARELLRQIQPGFLGAQTGPIADRIERILEQRGVKPAELRNRVSIQAPGSRPCVPETFALTAQSLFERRRLRMIYRPRSRSALLKEPIREISPQRLTWINGAWYLDAWCHRADEFRRFAVERIEQAELLGQPAAEIDPDVTAAHLDDAYGAYTGTPEATATLRFSAERAVWVADERWHNDQQGSWLPDGRYELSLPYSQPDELLMRILQYGPDCEVVAPRTLREAAVNRLRAALSVYRDQHAP